MAGKSSPARSSQTGMTYFCDGERCRKTLRAVLSSIVHSGMSVAVISLLLAACRGPAPQHLTSAPQSKELPHVEEVPTSRSVDPTDGLIVRDGFERRGTVDWELSADDGGIVLVSDVAHEGQQSLELHSVKTCGRARVKRAMDAAPYRGKSVRLRASIRTEEVSEQGYIWVGVFRQGDVLAVDSMEGRRVKGSTPWTAYTVEVAVPGEADAIVFGGTLRGTGRLWIDAISLEPIPLGSMPFATIEGVVHHPDGTPADGALVAVTTRYGFGSHLTTSDQQGRYTVKVFPDSYGVSASLPGTVAAYVPVERREAGVHQVPLKLGRDGSGMVVTVEATGDVDSLSGEALLLVEKVGAGGSDAFLSRRRADGRFRIQLPDREPCSLFILDGGFVGRGEVFRPTDGGKTQRIQVADRQPPPASFLEWIRRSAVPLATADPNHGNDDLHPLRDVIGNARIVALGEATHGTREIFQLKHRVLKYLVEALGFTVFAIEANWPESLAVNDYVLHGRGDPQKALSGMYFWTWDTQEVLAMIEWMRAYNASVGHEKKVKFYGVDIQTPRVAARLVRQFLEQRDPVSAEKFRATLALFEQSKARSTYSKLEGAERKRVAQSLASLVGRFDRSKRRDAGAVGKHTAVLMRQHARMLQQVERMYAANIASGYGYGQLRDKAMAENTKWILDTEPPGARMVLWAHNGHIQESPGRDYDWVTQGTHLKRMYGDRYLTIGFVFGQGAFQAWDLSNTWPASAVRRVEVGPAPVGSLGEALHRGNMPLFALDLREKPDASDARQWLATPRLSYLAGSTFWSTKDTLFTDSVTKQFDAIIYIDKTTRARPNPGGRRPQL